MGRKVEFGRQLGFWYTTVYMRKFKWKDCRSPPSAKKTALVLVVAEIVLMLLPGSVLRPSSKSLLGPLFMLSIEGDLVGYHWDARYGWNWPLAIVNRHEPPLVGGPYACLWLLGPRKAQIS
ncbi:unnamed protein product [Lupinus luteus]|uniref:Uncharacterized protein n=1 Tax=Lupinus luteus TaxID=3873 RepID=A0AAV1XQ95_LUPLU